MLLAVKHRFFTESPQCEARFHDWQRPCLEQGVKSKMESTPGIEHLENRSKKRIAWLVDDDKSLRTLFAEVLPHFAPLQIDQTFGSVPELLDALGTLPPPEVLVMDVNIGRDNGVDAIGPVLSRVPDLPIVMLTTCYDSLQRRKAYAYGATHFLLKSDTLENIASRIFNAKFSKTEICEPTDKPTRISSRTIEPVFESDLSFVRYVGGLHSWVPRLKAA
jgi:CheY-like chemotaxis protein